MRRFFLMWFLILCFCGTVLGCAAVTRSIKDYEACRGDKACLSDMTKVKEQTYTVTKSAASGIPFPSVPEAIAVVLSNVVSGLWGISHGRKLRKV